MKRIPSTLRLTTPCITRSRLKPSQSGMYVISRWSRRFPPDGWATSRGRSLAANETHSSRVTLRAAAKPPTFAATVGQCAVTTADRSASPRSEGRPAFIWVGPSATDRAGLASSSGSWAETTSARHRSSALRRTGARLALLTPFSRAPPAPPSARIAGPDPRPWRSNSEPQRTRSCF